MVWKTEFKNSAGAVKEGEEPAERESSRDEEWRDVAERNHCALLEIALAMRVSAGFGSSDVQRRFGRCQMGKLDDGQSNTITFRLFTDLFSHLPRLAFTSWPL